MKKSIKRVSPSKKYFILIFFLCLPVVIYLFLATAKHRFAKLPVVNENVITPNTLVNLKDEKIIFKNKITILGFLGTDPQNKKASVFNLSQKIYKRFYRFKDFQFVMVVPRQANEKLPPLLSEIESFVDTANWHFALAENTSDVKNLFQSLNSGSELADDYSTPLVFIIDKDQKIRGRDDDKQKLFGFNSNSVADLNNKMVDDVKVILAEYRMELKKYNSN